MRSRGKAQPAALPGWELSQCDLCRARGLCQGWGHGQPTPPAKSLSPDKQDKKELGGDWGSPAPSRSLFVDFLPPRDAVSPHPVLGGPPVLAQHL